MTGTPVWESTSSIYNRIKRELVDNDPNLNKNDRANNEAIALQLSWLHVTAQLGQYPRTYASLLKITHRITDVCSMTESDFMRLTGKTAYRTADGKFADATDYHGNAVKSECATFGNNSSGVFSYTATDVEKIGINYNVAITQYENEQIRQYLCTYNYMEAKHAKNREKELAIQKLSDSGKYTFYGYNNERMIEVIGMSHDAIIKNELSFKDVSWFVFRATWGSANFANFDKYDVTALHAGIKRDWL